MHPSRLVLLPKWITTKDLEYTERKRDYLSLMSVTVVSLGKSLDSDY
jgi:hypothetical protein